MKPKIALSFRLNDDVRKQLQVCSDKTGLPERTIAQMAITAAVAAAEKAGYRLVIPIEFDVKHVALPNPKPSTSYPPHRDEHWRAEETPKK